MGKILYQRCKVCMEGTSSKMGAAEKELEKTVNMLKACEDFFFSSVQSQTCWDLGFISRLRLADSTVE